MSKKLVFWWKPSEPIYYTADNFFLQLLTLLSTTNMRFNIFHVSSPYHLSFLSGCGNNQAYRFVHWSGIDSFVYFSHHFITIPPPGWTAAAHTNGVSVLGE